MEAAPLLMIPGLPNHIALLCLLKVPRIYHACLASVCIAWRNAVRCPQFYQERRRLGSTDAWLVLVSAEILSRPVLVYSAYDLSTRQLLFKVRFPPSLPVDGHTTYVKAPAHGVDSTCSIGFLGPYVPGACSPSLAVTADVNAPYNSKFADAKLPKDALGGKMSLNAEGAAVSGIKALDSMSRNAVGNNKAMGSTSPNAVCNGNCIARVGTCLHNLDHYRIVAMNEYFAVLGFTQRSGLHAAICTFTIYNTVTDEWRHTGPPGICREMFACGVIEGRLYIVGGWNERGEMERTTEVYDFEADRWGTAEGLPEGIGRIEGDVVYQGKLYVQCREEGEEGKCVLWVYNAVEDKWEEENGKGVGGQQLIATEKFMYAMGRQGELWRYESREGKWECVMRAAEGGKGVCTHTCQTAFGNGDDIFVLQETNGNAPSGLPSDGLTKCHRLLSFKPTWYHAGAVVNT